MENKNFDVIIIGGSYSGLAAAMALGRALVSVLVIDSGKPCNRQTPHSHNFLTQDGKEPADIAAIGKQQVALYDTVQFFDGLAISGQRTSNGLFEIQTASGEIFWADKLIFATGIKDIMPDVEGFVDCWGISVLHCPYCHGYEVRDQPTGILGSGENGYELAKLISNWTKDLTLFTEGKSKLTPEQIEKLEKHPIRVEEKRIERLEHIDGNLRQIIFEDGSKVPVKAIYTRTPFEQHCKIPGQLGCELTDDGYVRVDALQETTVDDVYACGDNVSRMRTLANAVAMGTTAGMAVSKKLVFERF